MTNLADKQVKKNVDPFHRYFGRRKGQALSRRQQEIFDRQMARIGIETPAKEGVLNLAEQFASYTKSEKEYDKKYKAFRLEIGFGKGEHLAWQAQNNPEIGFIGCEPYINGAVGLLTKIEEDEMNNIRVYTDDARDILEALPDACLDMVYLLHPDPWPKYRHARRRFVSQSNLDRISRVLRPGGEFRIGTDHPVYRQWTLVQMAARDDFVWLASHPSDWNSRPDDWPETRYEAKALEGRAVYLRYIKETVSQGEIDKR